MAIDRTSQVAFAELPPRATRMIAADFLRRVLEKLPYKAHKVLTDNGVQFTAQPPQLLPGGQSFDRMRAGYGVEHRLTKPAHPWTNGQVERMNRTKKRRRYDATITRPPTSSTSTCKPFCWPIIRLNGSRPCVA